jgi:hypothetical protein
MDLFTGMVGQLLTEVGPYLKWVNKNWPIVLIVLVTALLLASHRRKRKS